MKTVETNLPVGRILEIKVMPNGSYKVVQEIVEEVAVPKMALDGKFILVEAESLSLNDKFMKYEPRTRRETRMKNFIVEVIASRVKNFYRPVMDPYFIDDGIDYVAGKKPAVGNSYTWWFDTAKKYNPSRNSRLGTRLEYEAFLGVLIKKLVEEGKSVEWAWDAVCNDSRELGHYWNSENAKHDFEPTGSRCICGFYDLANTCKILAEDVDSFLAGGCYGSSSCNFTIADINYLSPHNHDNNDISVGWIVLS